MTPIEFLVDSKPLFYSNSPETLHQYHSPIALYQQEYTLDNGQIPPEAYGAWLTHPIRVMYHHQNLTGRLLKIGTVLTNTTTDKDIDLFVRNNSNGAVIADGKLTQRMQSASADPAYAGNLALLNWFQTSSAKIEDQSVALTLKPGESLPVLQTVQDGETATGMWDFVLSVASPATLVVSVVACDDLPNHPERLPLTKVENAPDGNWHQRGYFPSSVTKGSE